MTDEQWAEVRRLMEIEVPPGFVTGQTTVHWHEGWPMSVDVLKKGARGTNQAAEKSFDAARRGG